MAEINVFQTFGQLFHLGESVGSQRRIAPSLKSFFSLNSVFPCRIIKNVVIFKLLGKTMQEYTAIIPHSD